MIYYIKKMMALLVLCTWCVAQDSEVEKEKIDAARLLYEKGDFAGALEVYKVLEKKHAALIYNMGNCAYYLHHLDEALCYWLSAYRRATPETKRAIKNNCQKLGQDHGITIDKDFFLLVDDEKMPIIAIQIFFVITLIFFLVSFVCVWWRKKYFLFSLATMIFFLNAIALFLVYSKKNQRCVVTKTATDVYVGPDKKYPYKRLIKQYQLLRVINKKDGWSKIRYGVITGWVSNDSFFDV